MLLNGSISILANEDAIYIEVRDETSRELVVNVELTPEQFCSALSRILNVPCKKTQTGITERLGKEQKTDTLIFPMPEGSYKDRVNVARETAGDYVGTDWTADTYYGSKDSFFSDAGKNFARVTIRKWV